MHNNKPNLFPIVAVLTSAGILLGISGLLFWAIDQMGESPVLSTPLAQSLEPVVSVDTSEPSVVDTLDQPAVRSPAQITNSQITNSQILDDLGAAVLSIDISDDKTGRQLTTNPKRKTNALVASGSVDYTANVWPMNDLFSQSPLSQSPLSRLSHRGRVNALAFVPDDADAGKPRQRTFLSGAWPSSSPQNAKLLITGSGSGEIMLWSLPQGEAIATIADTAGRIMSLAVNASGQTFASGTSDGTLKVWPVAAVAAQKSQTSLRGVILNAAGPQLNALAFHPTKENILVSGDHSGTVQVWDTVQKKAILTLASDADRIVNLAISPDGQYVASGSDDRLIRIWNLESGRLIRTLSGHQLAVSDVAFSPDGSSLASSSYDGSIKTWNWASATALCTLTGHDGVVHTVAFANSRTLVSGGADGTLRSWDLAVADHRACLN